MPLEGPKKVPLSIDHCTVAPGSAMTDALPRESGQTVAGEKMLTTGAPMAYERVVVLRVPQ